MVGTGFHHPREKKKCQKLTIICYVIGPKCVLLPLVVWQTFGWTQNCLIWLSSCERHTSTRSLNDMLQTLHSILLPLNTVGCFFFSSLTIYPDETYRWKESNQAKENETLIYIGLHRITVYGIKGSKAKLSQFEDEFSVFLWQPSAFNSGRRITREVIKADLFLSWMLTTTVLYWGVSQILK